MNLLDIASKGRTYKKAGDTHGGEFHGPCPICGGTDRFHIWPQQGDYGTYWCRSCDKAGDAIQYLMDVEQMTFREAAKTVGKDVADQEEYQAPTFKRPVPTGEAFAPRETVPAAELWVEHATKLADWAHQQLLDSPDQLAWLARRGLDRDAVIAYGLGWNPGEKGKDLYRARESWGLPTVLKEDGKTKKKLWLPIGLVIPYRIDGILQRLRIRRTEGEPRYYLVPGSNTAPMLLGATAKAFVIVESELDALLIHHRAGDLAGVISQGNSTAKPDAPATAALTSALTILVALDSDEAGMQASVWWRKQFTQAERWPVPVGKDPGETYQAGTDIREWVKAGLPPVFHVVPAPLCQSPVASAPLSEQDIARRTEAISSMYEDINIRMPAGALEWLRSNRDDVRVTIQQRETDLDDAVRFADPQSFAHILDQVRRMWLRAWTLCRDATVVIQEPTRPRPAYQPELLP